jgi:acyl-CoA thioesterase-2
MGLFPHWDELDILPPLSIEPSGEDRFVNRIAQPNSFGWMFGGQCMGLAIAGACQTVTDQWVHAASGFFLRRGPVDKPTTIEVSRTFDGSSFCARDVTLGEDSKPVFRAQTSFQRPQSGVRHSDVMPTVAPPEKLQNLQQLLNGTDDRIKRGLTRRISVPPVVDLRPVSPRAYATGEDAGSRMAWMRITSLPNIDQNQQRALLAYLSDYWLAGTAANRHDNLHSDVRLLMSSLNQSIWYFGAFDLRDWHFFKVSAPVSEMGRAIARSDIFTRSGEIIASTVQEVLIRKNDVKETEPNQ